MNTSQGALHFGASIDLTEWRRNLDTMRRDIAGLSQTARIQTQNIDSAFRNLSVGIAGYFSVGMLKNFVMEMINVRGEFQKTEIAFTTMLGNAGKANALMGDMVELAAKTPFSLQDVSAGAKQLLAFQVPANEVVDTLTRMGNIAAGLSIPLSRINLVYGQVRAKGKLMGDDLRQFTEAGIPMVAELAKKFNKTTAEVSAMVSAGKIGFNDVKDVLFSLTNEGGMFFNLMEKQSKSVTGQIANMGDAWDQALNNMGKSQDGLISEGIQGLTFLISHYQDVGKVLLTLIEVYGAYKAALILTSALQGRIAAPAVFQGFANLIKLIRGATVAQTALNAASLENPYILLATVIAALIAVTYNYRQEIGELLGLIEETTTAQKVQEKVMLQYNESFGKGVFETKAAIEQLIYTIKSEYSTLEQREKAYKKLIAIDSSFTGTLDNQYKATNRLSLAFENLVKNMQKMAMAQAEVAVRSEAFKKYAETEMQLGINKVKMQDAEAAIERVASKLKAGKITIKEYAKETDKIGWRELKLESIELNKTLKEQRAEKELISRIDQKQIKDLQKGNSIIKAQLAGGKIQGKLLSAEGKAILQRELKNNEEILKVRFGIEPEINVEPEKVKGWAQGIKDQIAALEEELNAPATTQSRYYAIQSKIEKLNQLLNPKKTKQENRQLAEILPYGSVAELERRSQLIDEASRVAVNGMVRLRGLDKFGKDKDKNGNPYYTGEVITTAEATRRQEAINSQLKKLRAKSFDDEMSELERQWKIKYQIIQHYGEETAKAMFPDLKGESYYSDINKAFKDLDGKYRAGTISDKEIENWSKLKTILSGLNGTKDPFTEFTENIDKNLGRFKSSGEKIDFLTEKLYKLTDAEIKSGYKAEIFNLINNLKNEEQSRYQQLLNDHEDYSQRKINIEKETAISIKKIRDDSNLSPEDKVKKEKSVDKRSKEEISRLAVEELTTSKAWMALYGNIDNLTAYQMDALLKELESKQGDLQKVLTDVDFSVLIRNFRDVKNKITEENPFLGFFNSLQDMFDAFSLQSEGAGEKAYSAFDKATQGIKGTLRAAKGIVSTFAPAREYMSDAANDALETLDQIATMGLGMMEAIDGTVKAVKKALDKASWSNWITAIISIIYTVIKAVVSLFSWISGNRQKRMNRELKAWQIAVDDLKNSYEDLQRVIEKTAGEDQIKMQRELIKNLREQQKVLEQMRISESKKKKYDQEKIASYTQQIHEIDVQIHQVVDDFKTSVTTIEFKDLATKLADAFVEGFGKGEDAALSFEKVVDEVMKNAVTNALKVKLLQPVAEEFVNKLYSSMGFGNGGATQAQKDAMEYYKQNIAEVDKKLLTANSLTSGNLQSIKKYYQELLSKMQAEIAAGAMSGAFDGLTDDEIKALKDDYKNDPRIKGFLEGIKNINELFDTTIEGAQSLKGDIKGLTEKTGGAIESQFNAVRINIGEVLKIMQGNKILDNAKINLLSQIEVNTRNLVQIRKDMQELNSKVKYGAAGIP